MVLGCDGMRPLCQLVDRTDLWDQSVGEVLRVLVSDADGV